jgi:YhhN family
MSQLVAKKSSTTPRNLLLSLWAVLLLGGLIAGRSLPDRTAELASLIGRMGSSIVLVLLAWHAWQQRVGHPADFARWIALGMTLGCIGDLFNANLLQFIPLSDPTLGAIVTFGLGHLCYITAIVVQLVGWKSPNATSGTFWSIAGWQLIGLMSWYWIVFNSLRNKVLIWPALPYTLLLAGTAGAATALSIKQKQLWPLALGAALFLLSDLLLAYGMFQGSYPFRSEAVWMTYGPGQMLIVFSIWLVHRPTLGEA